MGHRRCKAVRFFEYEYFCEFEREDECKRDSKEGEEKSKEGMFKASN